MAKTFNKMVDLVERIPDINTTQYMFWSLLAKLHKEDQEKVVEYLMDCVTEQPVQQEAGK